MAGKPQKPAALLVNQRGGRGAAAAAATRTLAPLAPREKNPMPTAPKDLGPVARAAWNAVRSDPLAREIRRTDLLAFKRYCWCVGERERMLAEIKPGQEVLEGSTRQPVLNPVYKREATLTQEIQHYEGQFGLTLAARLHLRIQVGVTELQSLEAQGRLLSLRRPPQAAPRGRATADAVDVGPVAAVIEGEFVVRDLDAELA